MTSYVPILLDEYKTLFRMTLKNPNTLWKLKSEALYTASHGPQTAEVAIVLADTRRLMFTQDQPDGKNDPIQPSVQGPQNATPGFKPNPMDVACGLYPDNSINPVTAVYYTRKS